MANSTITVANDQVLISVDALAPLLVSPAGTYAFATVTVDAYGRVTAATNGTAATESTLQQVLANLDYIQSVIDGNGVDGGVWIYQV